MVLSKCDAMVGFAVDSGVRRWSTAYEQSVVPPPVSLLAAKYHTWDKPFFARNLARLQQSSSDKT